MRGAYGAEEGKATKIRVLVASEFALVVEGIRHSVEACNDIEVIGQAADGRDSIEQARSLQPDVVVIDSDVKVLDGFEATRRLLREAPKSKVIILTEHGNRDSVTAALLAGARGCLPKATSSADLASAIRVVHRGEAYLHPSLTTCLVEDYIMLRKTEAHDDPYERLTDREKHVLRLLAEGQTGRGVAQELGIAVKTALGHKAKVMKKLGIHARVELIKYAVRRGLVDLEH